MAQSTEAATEETKVVNAATAAATTEDEDQELEAMKRQVKEMEDEAAKLREMQKRFEEAMNTPATTENREDTDNRSIYIGNVDYLVTPEELQAHFKDCGTINRVTILCDKFTQQPKGFAYVEFASIEAIANALVLDGSVLHNRALKVSAKRTNVPGISSTNRPPRGFRARQMAAAAAAAAYYPIATAFRPIRPRFRSRRAAFHPYYQ